MDINQYLEQHKKIRDIRGGYVMRELAPQVACADGFTMSVQVSETHYCRPRENDARYYFAVEIGFPSAREDLLMEYAEQEDKPTETVYGYVPVEIVDQVIEKHGGFKS